MTRTGHRAAKRVVSFVVLGATVLGAMALGACSSSGDSSGHGQQKPTSSTRATNVDGSGEPLRELAPADFLVGAAVAADPLRNDGRYRKVLAREYNAVTPENAMKWDTIHPEQDVYDFGPADEIVDFARARDMAVRGHTLVWYRQVPAWVTDRSWTRAELEDVLHDHITKVVSHYRGKVTQWDVVNEAIDHRGELRDSVWTRVIGPDYIDLAFTWAHEADPDAELFYNDYDIERSGPKADAVEKLVRRLKSRDVPIDGVGIQAHELTVRTVSEAEMTEALERFARPGLDVAITELDVGIFLPSKPKNLDEQADVYRDMLGACLEVPRCSAFVTWGLTDRYSWVPGEIEGFGDALPSDSEYKPKPALPALRRRLAAGRSG